LNQITSTKILLFGYSCLALIFLYFSILNGIKDFGGNRSLGAMVILAFALVVLFGLVKLPKYFTIISALNFLVGSCIVGYINVLVLPDFKVSLLVTFGLGVIGLAISINAYRVARGL